MKTRPFKWCRILKSEWGKLDEGLCLKKRLGLRKRLVSSTRVPSRRKYQVESLEEEVRNLRWQGSLVTTRLQDEKLSALTMILLAADRVHVLSNTHNRRNFRTAPGTITNLIICQSEDPYKFGGRGVMQVV